MKTSESIAKIAKALKEFQEVAKNAFKEKSGYNYKYAPIDVILKENRPLMAKYGLCHIQSQTMNEGIIEVETRIIHESGEWIETSTQSKYALLKSMNDYQSLGSGITYLRRYGLSAALGIAADEDADAHGEQEKIKYNAPSRASDTEKAQAWESFVEICVKMDIDAKEFLSADIDMTDKALVYKTVRQWLNSEDLLRQQLLVFKQGA